MGHFPANQVWGWRVDVFLPAHTVFWFIHQKDRIFCTDDYRIVSVKIGIYLVNAVPYPVNMEISPHDCHMKLRTQQILDDLPNNDFFAEKHVTLVDSFRQI
jgi:hypothetical protein